MIGYDSFPPNFGLSPQDTLPTDTRLLVLLVTAAYSGTMYAFAVRLMVAFVILS